MPTQTVVSLGDTRMLCARTPCTTKQWSSMQGYPWHHAGILLIWTWQQSCRPYTIGHMVMSHGDIVDWLDEWGSHLDSVSVHSAFEWGQHQCIQHLSEVRRFGSQQCSSQHHSWIQYHQWRSWHAHLFVLPHPTPPHPTINCIQEQHGWTVVNHEPYVPSQDE